MDNYNWEEDTWVDITHENGEVFDANLWTCDKSGRQYISFYETFRSEDEWGASLLNTNGGKPVATFKVIQEDREVNDE